MKLSLTKELLIILLVALCLRGSMMSATPTPSPDPLSGHDHLYVTLIDYAGKIDRNYWVVLVKLRQPGKVAYYKVWLTQDASSLAGQVGRRLVVSLTTDGRENWARISSEPDGADNAGFTWNVQAYRELN